MERWLPEVEKCTAHDIVALSNEVSDEDFFAILADEYFPTIDKEGFYDMRIDITREDEDTADLFERAYAAYHQVPDISFLP